VEHGVRLNGAKVSKCDDDKMRAMNLGGWHLQLSIYTNKT